MCLVQGTGGRVPQDFRPKGTVTQPPHILTHNDAIAGLGLPAYQYSEQEAVYTDFGRIALI